MKKIDLTAILLFICMAVSAQTWQLMTSNTTANLYDIWFLNNTTGFACGANGTFLKTTDGGTTWTSKNLSTTKSLTGMQFLNSTTGYLFNYQSLGANVFKTTDGGNTWNDISLNLPTYYSGGACFLSPDTGFLSVGYYGASSYAKILRTVNGGVSWDTVYSGNGWISFVDFPDGNNGYATVSGSGVLKTTNRGANWILSTVGGNLWMSGLYFFTKDVGFVGGGDFTTGGGKIFKTTDGGTTWQTVNTAYSSSRMVFSDANHGYNITGMGTQLVVTTDGGSTWTQIATPSTDTLHSVFFVSPTLGYAVGHHGNIIRYGTPAGVSELSSRENQELKIYPNPVANELNIETCFSEKLNAQLFDITGKQVTEKISFSNSTAISTQEISGGIYFLKITNADFGLVKMQKVMVVK
ncbi:MAG: YCF48-related protein [Bacteroidia bacterium]